MVLIVLCDDIEIFKFREKRRISGKNWGQAGLAYHRGRGKMSVRETRNRRSEKATCSRRFNCGSPYVPRAAPGQYRTENNKTSNTGIEIVFFCLRVASWEKNSFMNLFRSLNLAFVY